MAKNIYSLFAEYRDIEAQVEALFEKDESKPFVDRPVQEQDLINLKNTLNAELRDHPDTKFLVKIEGEHLSYNMGTNFEMQEKYAYLVGLGVPVRLSILDQKQFKEWCAGKKTPPIFEVLTSDGTDPNKLTH